MIYLASKSPRRIELLQKITPNFKVKTFDFDETSNKLSPLDKSVEIATKKANLAKQFIKDGAIIVADTIVVFNNKTIGKPKDDNDAIKILNLLSDKTHLVITTYVITVNQKSVTRSVISEVTFNKLSETLITDYVKTGSYKDKAGGYGVQDSNDFPLIKCIKGSYTNVMGFPLDEIKEDLKRMNLI